ncbi:MAG: hypothetical protein VW450_01165 [Chloroflexota bacterium]
MAAMVPESERERSYMIWYDLSLLEDQARLRCVPASELAATHALVVEAWDRYLQTIQDWPVRTPRT